MTSSDDAVEPASGKPDDDSTRAPESAATTAPGARRSGLSPAMKYTLWGVGAVVVIGIVVALVLLFSPPTNPPGDSPGAGSQNSPSPAATAGPSPDAAPADGSEVPSPDPTATPGAGLPPREGDEQLVTAPLPQPASAEGRLVDGFPVDIMGPDDESEVLSSSIAVEGDTMQVTVVARTDAPEADIIEHYRALWSGLGLSDAGASGSSALSYGNDFSSLTLAFTPSSGTGTVYMVYGVLRAA